MADDDEGMEITMIKGWFSRSKRLLAGAALLGALAVPFVASQPAEAGWGGWHGGWHGGWGWHGGFAVGLPPIVVGAPLYAPAYRPAPYPYAPYPYAPAYRWLPAHYTPWGAYVPGHWGY